MCVCISDMRYNNILLFFTVLFLLFAVVVSNNADQIIANLKRYHAGNSAQLMFDANTAPETAGSDCVIKGNISFNGGRRIYHLPGQADYDRTIIRPEYGERWFCSEQEALNAGWKRARN